MSHLVLSEIRNNLGIITLNSEKTLNSLSQPMVDEMFSVLRSWRSNPQVSCVFIQGAGEKAFCAGGDVRQLFKALAEHNKNPSETPSEECLRFFISEYTLDYEIHSYSKPIVIWGHGIVMGGGIGLMNGASHRIVTEKTKLAMPEITIGLYPDVGATWFFNKLPAGYGLFLGMTAARINAGDALYLGMADAFMMSTQKEELIKKLQDTKWQSNDKINHSLVTDVISNFSRGEEPPVSIAQAHKDLIAQFENVHSVREFRTRLSELPKDEWITEAQNIFEHGSPSSAGIILEQLRRGKNMTLEEVFQSELNLSVSCSLRPDFPEGVRALLIDKDQNPHWSPKTFEEITPEWIESFFKPHWAEGKNPLYHLGKLNKQD